jgi:hypothetical protein
MDVALDTSAALRFIRDRAVLASVREHTLERDARLVIPILCLVEVAAPSNVSFAAEGLSVVGELREALGGRFGVGHDLTWILRSEKRNRGGSSRVPVMPQSKVARLTVPVAAGTRPPWIDEYLRKQETHATDKTVRRDFPALFPNADAEDVDALMNDFVFQVTKDGGFGLEHVVGGARWFQRAARSEPTRYPATILLAGLAQLQAYACAFVHVPNRHANWPSLLLRPEPNDWVDIRIAASAAHADIFVSNDERQRARLNFVAERFGLRVRAFGLNEWLASP